MLNPGPNRAKPPDFHKMDPDQFEEMTRALHDKDLGVVRTSLYRTKRQPQFGVDTLAELSNGSSEVASCKCYAALKKGMLADFSEDFLKHWESRWKQMGVRRFVLATAADVQSAQRDAEVQAEKARFAALGIAYEVWAPHQLLEKLRAHPGIVSQYLGPHFVAIICGEAPTQIQPAQAGRDFLDALAVAQVAKLQDALSDQVGHRLDALLDRLRSGDLSVVEAALSDLRAGPRWSALNAGTRARVLRLRASTRLQRGDVDGAGRLADEADALAPQDEPRLRATLAYHRDGPRRALEVLGEPRSQDGAHFRGAMLLAAGDPAAAGAVLDGHPAVDPAHPETSRLRVLAGLLAGEPERALRHADAAAAAAPAWPAVRMVAAMARYACALSPALGPETYLRPNPVDLDLVREDDASRARLVEALAEFDTLAARDAADDSRRESEEFALACLCNLRDRLPEAQARCEAMLAADPARAVAAAWALARGFPVDRTAVAAAIRGRLAAGSRDGEQVLFLAVLEDDAGRPADAAALLEEHAAAFAWSPAAESLRDHWVAEYRRRAEPAVPSAPDERHSLGHRLVSLAEGARTSGDWSAVEALFAELAAEGGPHPLALAAAQMLASGGRWHAIAPHAGVLLELRTAEAVRLAAFAAFEAARYREALQVLDGHRSAFPHGRLPSDLRRMEVEALARAGDAASAVRRAAALAAEEGGTTQDRMLAALAHLRTGDVEAAAPLIRGAEEAGGVGAEQALRLAPTVAAADPGLARRLWQRAVSSGPPAALTPGAVAVAFRLGLDREAAPLVAGLGELARVPESGVRAIDLDGLVEEMRARAEHGERVAQAHLRGELPVHLAVAATGANLARLFDLGDQDAGAGGERYPVLLLNGARARLEADPPPLEGARLHLDLTALLVADQLGLLDALGRAAGVAVLVPPSLPAALLEIEGTLRHPQPTRLAAARAVVEAVRTGAAERHRSPVGSGAAVPDAWVVDHDPDDEPQQSMEPHSGHSRRANLRALADALVLAGALDPSRRQAALEGLGAAGREQPIGAPLEGDAVLLRGSAGFDLALADLLAASTAAFEVRIDAAALDSAEAEVAAAAESGRVADRVRALRARVAQELKAGRFSTIPADPRPAVGGEAGNDAPRSALYGSLAELVRAPGVPGGLVWIDDRALNGHPDCNGNRVAATPEMLGALAAAGILTPTERWAAMLRLRASRALFVPLEAEEVTHHLLAAPVARGAVVETPALSVLRRNVADALVHGRHLAVGPPRGGAAPGEVPFLLSLRGLAERAILDVWTRPGDTDASRVARSEWIWKALRADRLPQLPLGGHGPAGSPRVVPALRAAGLLANGVRLLLSVERAEREARLRAYFAWVERGALPPWLAGDAASVRQVASLLAGLFAPLADEAGRPAPDPAEAARYARALVGRVAAELPSELREALLREPRFARFLGAGVRKILAIQGREFDPDAFWKAVRRALARGAASVATADGRGKLVVRRAGGTGAAVAFSGVLDGGLDDPILALLAPGRQARRRAAERLVAGLGLPPGERARAATAVAAPEGAADRMDALAGLRERSVAFRLAALRERLGAPRPVPWDEFAPPEPSAALRHLGLEPDAPGDFVARLEGAGAALVRDFGAAEAVLRLASLPVPLPAPVLSAVRSLARPEREALLGALTGPAATPLRRLHALRLHRDLAGAGLGNAGSRDAALSDLVGYWLPEARLFVAVLRHAAEGVRLRVGAHAGGLRPEEGLAAAWSHADGVALALAQAGHAPEEAVRAFEGRREDDGLVERAVVRDPAFDGAAASPFALSAESLLFHGLGYALGTEAPDETAMPAGGRLEALRAVLSAGAGSQRAPSPWLLADRAHADDTFGSWMRARPAWLFPPPADLSETGAEAALARALADLGAADGGQPELWVVLGALSRPSLGPEARVRAAEALDVADFVSMVEADRRMGLAALRGAGELAAAVGEASAAEAAAARIEAVAEHLAGVFPGRVRRDAPCAEAVAELLEAAAAASRSGTAEAGWARFAPMVLRITRAWPAATALIRDVVEALSAAAHPDAAAGLWDACVRLRAMR